MWQVLNFRRWAKSVIISQVVDANDSILELECGPGQEIGRWKRAKLGHYTGVDILIDFFVSLILLNSLSHIPHKNI